MTRWAIPAEFDVIFLGFNHRGTKTQSLICNSDDAVLDEGGVEIDEQAEGLSCQREISDEPRLVVVKELADGLEFGSDR